MSALSGFPKFSLTHGPTPIERLSGLSAELGVNIWIKRDDCTGLAGGGNKTRKLEFLVADAIAKGADTLVTFGAYQSNHARQTAAAAAKAGLKCILILEPVGGLAQPSYFNNGNLLLDELLGASIEKISPNETADTAYERVRQQLISQGHTPYSIPVGGSNPLGSLGYAVCAHEIVDQTQQLGISFNQIVLATGSAGTQAGLLAGLLERNHNIDTLGFCVSRSGSEQQALVASLLTETLSLLKLPSNIGNSLVQADGNYYGEGYGLLNQATRDAVKLVARTDGILLDPVYTGKAMAGLIDYCRNGKFSPQDNVLFLHTGGSQGLFAYAELFED